MSAATRSALLRLAIRNCRRNWRYSVASLVTLIAGVASLSLFQGYILALDDSYRESITRRLMVGDVAVDKPAAGNDEIQISRAEQTFIEDFARDFGVRDSVRFLAFSGTLATARKSAVVFGAGLDIAAAERLRAGFGWNAITGRPIQGDGEILLGLGLSRALGCDAPPLSVYVDRRGRYVPTERPLACEDVAVQLSANTLTGQANAIDFTVHGLTNALVKEVDDGHALISLADAQRLLATDVVTRYAIVTGGGDDRARRFAREFNARAAAGGHALRARHWVETPLGDFYLRAMALIGIYRNFIGAIFIVIAGLAIFNTTLKVIHERTREIGALRSLGFTRRQLVGLFLTETGFTALLGCVLGVAVTLVTALAVNRAGIFYQAGILSEPVPFQLAYSPSTYAVVSFFLVLVALVASYLPVREALNAKVVDNLNQI